MKVLVTGSLENISKTHEQELLQNGYEVVAVSSSALLTRFTVVIR
ncbi:MAG: hypothetical protein JWQ85_3787 [Mucilaginibacter sp.]|nr:hypothetical protein [Mucilaginibacter sp.]